MVSWPRDVVTKLPVDEIIIPDIGRNVQSPFHCQIVADFGPMTT